MSLASDYAAVQAAAEEQGVAANAAEPPRHECQYCSMNVERDGSLRIVPGTGMNTIIAPPDDALEMARWIIDTFGEP